MHLRVIWINLVLIFERHSEVYKTITDEAERNYHASDNLINPKIFKTMQTTEQVFLNSPLVKDIFKYAEKNIKHWAVIVQDILESALIKRGMPLKQVRVCVNVATKHFEETHKAEIDATFRTLGE